MLITITTTSQTLNDILSAANEALLEQFRNESKLILNIQNLGVYDVYVEKGAAATTAAGAKIIKSGGTLELKVDSFDDLNLISDGTNNANIRLFPV